jgi:quercetin dioxygenase-like cupin family protein
MRIVTMALVLLGSALAVSAQPSPMNAGAAPAKQQFDVPMNGKPQTVFILNRVFKPKEELGWHTHAGTEITWVVRGTMRLRIRGGEARTYKAGDSFIVPRGVVHSPVNIGNGEVEVAVTYVLDKGAAMRDPVP